MKYQIDISESAEKSLAKIPKRDRTKILDKIDDMALDPMPNGSIKLQGHKPPLYRIRYGDYRIIYSIHNDKMIVLVVEVGHRREIYR